MLGVVVKLDCRSKRRLLAAAVNHRRRDPGASVDRSTVQLMPHDVGKCVCRDGRDLWNATPFLV